MGNPLQALSQQPDSSPHPGANSEPLFDLGSLLPAKQSHLQRGAAFLSAPLKTWDFSTQSAFCT